MGNSQCNCLKSESVNGYNNQFQSYKTNDVVFDVVVEENNEEKTGLENMENKVKSRNVKIQKKNVEMESECPGSELANDQDLGRVNENVEQTEKRLGELKLEDEEFLREYSEIKKYSILYPDNSIYIGTYNSHWKKEGLGTLFLADGSKYTGQFEKNAMSGKGRLIYSDGDYYEGDFKEDQFHGFGVYEKVNEGVKYEGKFKNEVKSGYGEETRTDGSAYKGEFVDDIKQGKGKFEWTDGSIFEGQFNLNNIQGMGRITYADSKIYLGSWKSNKFEGRGVFFWPDNQCYVGGYQNDKKSGFGVFNFYTGKKFEGYWLNGKQHGFGICSFKGVVRLGEWRFGKKIRWIALDLDKAEEDIKEIIKDIRLSSQECHNLLNDFGIASLEDENIKEKLLSVLI